MEIEATDIKKECVEIIENYFDSKLTDLSLDNILRYAWRVEEKGYTINMQDLRPLNKSQEWRVWINRDSDNLEIPFGQCNSEALHSISNETTNSLANALLYTISKWCKYEKYMDTEIEWKKSTTKDVKLDGFFKIDNKSILLYRIYDLDYFHLEYIDYSGNTINKELKTFDFLTDIKYHAKLLAYNNIVQLVKNTEKYNLLNNK